MRSSEVFVVERRGLGRSLVRLFGAVGRFLVWKVKKISRKVLRT